TRLLRGAGPSRGHGSELLRDRRLGSEVPLRAGVAGAEALKGRARGRRRSSSSAGPTAAGETTRVRRSRARPARDGQPAGPATIEAMPPPIARAARLRADLDRLADAV